MEPVDIEKSEIFVVSEILEYVPHSVMTKTINRKTTGSISAIAFDSGARFTEKISPFDTFIQIIEGTAEILIDGKSFVLGTGQSIVIPAHCRNAIVAKERFKMISTIIKSGYEDVS